LVMIPSGYENGTLGSLKPTDGTGDFTFSRGSDISATRVNEQGYIEKGYENFLLQSNSFLTSPWEIQFGSHTLTSGQLGYDGTNDAWLVQKESSVNHYVKQSISVSGINTFSFYAKNNTTNGAGGILIDSGLGGVVFNLENGTIYYQTGVNASIEPINNDWYRCSFTFNGSSSLLRFQVVSASGSDDVIGKSIYIQDAMLNQGMVAYPYVETTTAPVAGGILEDEPRLDYSGGASCPSLLLEPQRTNFITQSEYIDGSYWTKDRVTISNNATTSPEGKLNASKIIEDSQNGIHRIFRTISGTNNVLSFFAKADERQWISVFSSDASYSYFNVGDGTLGTIASGSTATIEDYGNGWYRCSLHNFYSSSAIINITTGNGDAAYQGDGTSGLYIYGIQVEQATYPTSYIPTNGTSQTRLKDVCVDAGDASTFNDSEGVLYIEIATLANDGTRTITLSDGGNSNSIYIGYNTNGRLDVNLRSGGVYQAAFNYTGVANPSEINKIAFKYKQNDFALWVNGVEVGTDSSGITPIGLDKLNFSTTNAVADFFFGNVNQVLYFPTALSDDECIELTTI